MYSAQQLLLDMTYGGLQNKDLLFLHNCLGRQCARAKGNFWINLVIGLISQGAKSNHVFYQGILY